MPVTKRAWLIFAGILTAISIWGIVSCGGPAKRGQVSKPAAPGDLKTLVQSNHIVKITWADNSDNEDYFAVYRATGNDTGWKNLGIIESGHPCIWQDGSVEPDMTYRYGIAAHNDAGNSDYAYADVIVPADSLLIKWRAWLVGTWNYFASQYANSSDYHWRATMEIDTVASRDGRIVFSGTAHFENSDGCADRVINEAKITSNNDIFFLLDAARENPDCYQDHSGQPDFSAFRMTGNYALAGSPDRVRFWYAAKRQ